MATITVTATVSAGFPSPSLDIETYANDQLISSTHWDAVEKGQSVQDSIELTQVGIWDVFARARLSNPFGAIEAESPHEIVEVKPPNMVDLVEYYNTNDDDALYVFGPNLRAQAFTIGTTGVNQDYEITSVKVKWLRVGLPGTINVSIRNTGLYYPTGSDLSTGSTDGNTLPVTFPAEWREIAMTPCTLLASTKYALVVSVPGGNSTNFLDWTMDFTDPTYTGGIIATSSDSGLTWRGYTGTFMFEIYGRPVKR